MRAGRRLLFFWRLRGQEGQALVEFAIVAPLIVMVLLFAIWFYELIHVRLKVQEAARFAAWEATAYPLHDYAKGRAQLSTLRTSMETGVRSETVLRYADLDSAKAVLGGSNPLLAASWKPPVVLFNTKSSRNEETVPGGALVNLLFGIGGKLFDYVSALRYGSPNPVAQALIGKAKIQGKSQIGAGTDRLFGNPDWGFNPEGYVEATVTVALTNNWFNHGVGNFLLAGKKVYLLSETHGVLADAWTLDDGRDVHSRGTLASLSGKDFGYWKQMERMYLTNAKARLALETNVKALYISMNIALGLTGYTGTLPIKEQDLARPTVASKSYTSTMTGRVQVTEDVLTRHYDTAPVGQSVSGGDSLTEYGKTLNARGDHFMGCPREMSLGCPSSTLQQDNPFGDYLWRP